MEIDEKGETQGLKKGNLKELRASRAREKRSLLDLFGELPGLVQVLSAVERSRNVFVRNLKLNECSDWEPLRFENEAFLKFG